MTCDTCGTAMKPLLTGFFCPNDCDRTSSYDGPYYTWYFSSGPPLKPSVRLGMWYTRSRPYALSMKETGPCQVYEVRPTKPPTQTDKGGLEILGSFEIVREILA